MVFDEFWEHHPAFFIGVSVFLGVWIYLQWSVLSYSDLAFFPCFLIFGRYLLRAAVGIMVGVIVAHTCLSVPLVPGVYRGTATVEVLDRRITTYHGRSFWREKLYIHSFSDAEGNQIAKGISTYISAVDPLYGGTIYQVPATLSVDDSLQCRWRVSYKKKKPLASSWSFVEQRVRIRRYLQQAFVSLFANPEIRSLAGAISFGVYANPSCGLLMRAAGLNHLLAISGFHFGVIAAAILLLTRRCSVRWRFFWGVFSISCYFLLIGPLPSVLRAWIASMLVSLARLLRRQTTGFNCVGVGLLVICFVDPSLVVHVGCQLSFLATLAILFFSTLCRDFFRLLVRKRSFCQVMNFSLFDKIMYVVARWAFGSASFILPVFLVLAPYQLCVFYELSFMALLYNLCIPLLFSVALPLILVSVLFAWIPAIASIFSYMAAILLRVALFCVSYVPETFSYSLGFVSPRILWIWVISFMIIGVLSQRSSAKEAWKACL